jgi:O-antigen ligase
METFRTMSSHVAHNSFIHCYAELGIGGGTLFVAAFYFAARGLLSLRPAIAAAADDPTSGDPELRRLYPFFVALVVSYVVGISFLSRSYVVPTYQILGLATVYLRLHAAQAPVAPPDWGRFLLPRLAGIGGCFLAASYTFVRLFVN